MSIQPFEQWETAVRSHSRRKRSFNLTFGFGIAQRVCKILEHRRNRFEPSGEPGGMIVRGENLLLCRQNPCERGCFFDGFRASLWLGNRRSGNKSFSIPALFSGSHSEIASHNGSTATIST
jgi:hypothetical protein